MKEVHYCLPPYCLFLRLFVLNLHFLPYFRESSSRKLAIYLLATTWLLEYLLGSHPIHQVCHCGVLFPELGLYVQ